MSGKTVVISVALRGSERITLANESAYFCGFADFTPKPIGSHLPGEMGGLWDPPLRLVRGIEVKVQGEKALPSRMNMNPTGVELDYGSLRIGLSMPEPLLLFVEVKNAGRLAVEVVFDISTRPMWLSTFDASCLMRVEKGGVRLSVPAIGREYLLETNAGRLHAGGGKILAGDESDFAITLRHASVRADADPLAAVARTARRYSRLAHNTALVTEDRMLSQAFHWGKHSLLLLTHNRKGIGRGLTAGHCDFPWFFSVDFFYSIDALLETGLVSVARDTLRLFIRYARRQGGRVPHEIVTNGVVYNQGDLEESAMLSTAILKYVAWTGDVAFGRSCLRDALASLDFVNSAGFTGPGIMEDKARGHSMEIDTLCYFVEGVESVHALQKAIFGRNAGPFHERLLELRRSADRALGLVNSVMWSESLSTYANRLTGGVPEYLGFWTSIVPFVTGLASRDRYLSFVGSRDGLKGMTGPDGLSIGTDRQRTMAIQNGLMSLAASRYDDSATALHFYMSNIPHAGEFMPGVVPEILGDAAGCYLQAWSSAALIHPLVGGILGIIPLAGRLQSGKRVDDSLEGLKISALPFRGKEYSFEVSGGRVAMRRGPARRRGSGK